MFSKGNQMFSIDLNEKEIRINHFKEVIPLET